MLGRRARRLVDRAVGGVDAAPQRRLDRLRSALRDFVPPSMQLAQHRLGGDGAGERPRCCAADTVGDDQNKWGGMHRNEGRRAHRRDVPRFEVCNQKGILIVVPDQPDIRDSEYLCNQL